MSEREEMITYKVVVNHEEQYSIWPANKDNALGWRDAGFNGSKADALAYINEHWTDMRPLSLRQHMERDQHAPVPTAVTAGSPLPVAAAADESAQPAKARRGWFGRQRDEQPTPVAVAATEAPSETPAKRGWFGRRRNS